MAELLKLPRPHIRGWDEPAPEMVEGVKCDHCGHTTYHEVIVHGVEETRAIIFDMKPASAVEVRP